MKTKLYFLIILCAFFLLIVLPKSFAQEVLPPRVRLIYFLPKDRPVRPERKVALQKLILDTQKDFADLMERYGFGRKTFTLESDRQGTPRVHYVNGKFSDAHYIKGNPRGAFGKVLNEIHEQFDMSKDFYLVAIDGSLPKIGGIGGMSSGHSGYAMMPAWGDHFLVTLAAHELYHSFGLHHPLNAHDDYFYFTRCAAEWFNVHPAFNRSKTLVNHNSTVEMLPPTLAASPNVIRLRFKVADPDGIRHIHLNKNEPGDTFLLDCTALDGKNSSTVEFVTDYLSPKTDSVRLSVMDVHGNIEESQSYPINITTLLPRPKVVSIPDPVLAELIQREIGNSITTHTILKLDVLFANGFISNHKEVTDLTGLEHAHYLQRLYLRGDWVSDFSVLAKLSKLRSLSVSRLSDVSALPRLPNLRELNITNSSVSAAAIATQYTSRFPNLKFLSLSGNNISDVSALSGLPQLNSLSLNDNNISDISTLSELTELNTLNLINNNISDVSALSGLTKLEWLRLRGNNISDISTLSELPQLAELDVRGSPLSYASIHTHIPAMQARGVNVKFNKRTHPALLKVSGDGQVAEVGTPLASPFVVEVVNGQGKPMKGVRVNFRVTAGGGVCRPTTATTNAKGRIQAKLRLGSTPGMNAVTVTAKGIRSSVIFTARATGPPIYWIDADTGALHQLIGTEVENLVPNVKNATSLAADIADGKLYWTEITGKRTGRIRRAMLDGTNVQLVKNLKSVPHSLALDAVNGKLYLTNAWGKVQRMNVDGSNFQPNLITGLDAPKSVVLDVMKDKLYWIEQTSNTTGKLQSANLDGSNVQLVKNLTSAPQGLALDTVNGKLYLTNAWGKIQRMNVDGSNFQPNLITGLNAPQSLAIDSTGGKLYWTQLNSIRCANLTGKYIQNVVTGLRSPVSIVLSIPTVGATAPAAPATLVIVPDETDLYPNYPNPFNPETWIPYQLAQAAAVSLTLYDINGHAVRTLDLGYQPAGVYQSRSRAAYWDGRNAHGEPVASGIYFYTLTAGDFIATRKMLILK